jgi:ADP-ribose pyrophosphatase YjhB (NUDIX family)
MSVVKPEYQTPLIGAYLVLIQDNKILLNQRNDAQYKGVYSLVCGHVEKGENVIEAIVREAFEEVGIKIMQENTKVIASIHRPSANYKNNIVDIIDFFILVTDYTGEIKNLEPDKTQDVLFWDIENLPKNCTQQVKKALELYKNNDFYGVL